VKVAKRDLTTLGDLSRAYKNRDTLLEFIIFHMQHHSENYEGKSMALLAEELVQEWLNRQGFFTIRGIKVGVDEIDLLAIKIEANGIVICRHLEVQASMRPISYLSQIPKPMRVEGQPATSAKLRTTELLQLGVKEWVAKKFTSAKKVSLLKSLCSGNWTSELVINNVKSEEEIALIANHGIRVIRLPSIIKELNTQTFMIQSASGSDFAELLNLASINL
jgi:hypothetical protein